MHNKNKCMDKNNFINIKLDIGCGKSLPAGGWVGLDKRDIKDVVSIVHDIEKTPWPLDDNSCQEVRLFNVLEYINPALTLEVFDEVWRITMPAGSVYVRSSYASSSSGFNDPLKTRTGLTEDTFTYLDPRCPEYAEYESSPFEVKELKHEVDNFVYCRMIPIKKFG
jgi:hypothetical protein